MFCVIVQIEIYINIAVCSIYNTDLAPVLRATDYLLTYMLQRKEHHNLPLIIIKQTKYYISTHSSDINLNVLPKYTLL